ILQTFYSWMTIYSVIYLREVIGFSWENLGVILVVMLIPFPIIQYPLGKISDKLGEKRIMAIGFTIMGISTMALSFISSHSVAVWACALLVTRIGAAAAEVMMETYFFKTASMRDSAVLGAFRVTRPLSYFFAPLIMGASLLFTTHQYVFVVVGVICLLAIYPVMRMRDVR
ncbi:MAG: MFS transporter, partial [Candidatus Taylorbacteria bacterium]